MNADDANYYHARSRQEAAAALIATDPAIVRVHVEMAARYAAKAEGVAGSDKTSWLVDTVAGDGAENIRPNASSPEAGLNG